MKSNLTAFALVTCLALESCSSRPREFTPTLAAAVPNQTDFDTAYATCRQLLANGMLNASGRTASAGAGAAAGATTAAVGGTTAAAIGGWTGVAAASATIVLLPFAIVGGAWGMSKMRRAKKERAIKVAMEGCLRDRGYQVAGWSKAAKKPVVLRAEPVPAS